MRAKTWLYLLLGLTGLSLNARALPTEAYAPGTVYHAEQWRTLDLVFAAHPGTVNPFDLEFSATFTGPAGETLKVPGFFDGADHFVVRFTAPAPGKWSFQTNSSLAALDRRAGSLQATVPASGRHGPVVVDPANPRRLQYADGSKYYPISFEADWVFALDAESPTGTPRTEAFVDYLAKNGFNQLVLNVFAYDVQWPRAPQLDPQYDYGKPRVYPFGGTNATPDHSTLNVTFFQRLDRVIEVLDRHGIAAHLMIYVWNKNVNWPVSRSAEDNRYFDYVVKRYQGFPNLIWDISKEATGYGHNDKSYITERIDRLHALDSGRRLVTVHDYAYCSDFPAKVDFISIQNWQPELWHVMLEVRTKHPDKPILNIEHGGYEQGPYHVFTGAYLSASSCLERAYLSIFAGAYTTHYWQDAAWNVIIPDPTVLPVEQRPHYEYYRHLAALNERVDLSALEPAKGRANSAFCLSNEKDRFVYLIPDQTSAITINLPKEADKERVSTWFDPLTGVFSSAHDPAKRPTNTYFPPRPDQLWILIVETNRP